MDTDFTPFDQFGSGSLLDRAKAASNSDSGSQLRIGDDTELHVGDADQQKEKKDKEEQEKPITRGELEQFLTQWMASHLHIVGGSYIRITGSGLQWTISGNTDSLSS